MSREYPARPIVGVGVVVCRGEEVLLIRRGQPPRLGQWSLPGGGQEVGETIEEAVRREVREETGLADLDFAWGHDFIETEPYAGGKVVRFYVARTGGEGVSLPINPLLGRAEHHEYRWFAIDAALGVTVPRLQRVLEWAAERIGLAPAQTTGT